LIALGVLLCAKNGSRHMYCATHLQGNSFKQALIDSVIAMWLGHESMDTTQMYLHANIELKDRVQGAKTAQKLN
jgi:integrase